MNFYIDFKEGKISKRAQIFLKSIIRNEQLTTYFPKLSDAIEEFEVSSLPQYIDSDKKIYEFDRWRDALRDAIEKSSSDIAKASEVAIQIASSTSLDFRFTFRLDNRTWKRHFPFKEEDSK